MATIAVTIIIATLLPLLCIAYFLFNQTKAKAEKLKPPPGVYSLPLIGGLLWLRLSVSDLVPILRRLRAKHGPLFSIRIGSHSAIFLSSHSLAHQALVQNGAVFADRPPLPASRSVSSPSDAAPAPESHPLSVNSSNYGPTWRLLRRNLSSEILHPSRLLSFQSSRRSVLRRLVADLRAESSAGNPVRVVDFFRLAVFRSLCFMCFGEDLEDATVREMESIQKQILEAMSELNILSFWPRLGGFLHRNRLKELAKLRERQRRTLLPPIRSRIEKLEAGKAERIGYVDTLVGLRLPPEEGGRALEERDIVRLCSELLNAGSDSTAASLQWIMAELVRNPAVQERLFAEMEGAVTEEEEEEEEGVREEDLQRMPYLKAVVLEGLRRHPPLRMGLPHGAAAAAEATIGGYAVPRGATVNFMVEEMGLDGEVWEAPMEFRPERFVTGKDGEGEGLDVTGSREIKMMPFGAGRRMCPGYALALVQLEYFVGSLVWEFEWKGNGEDVDLSEKDEFSVVMKHPLEVRLAPRASLKKHLELH